MPVQNAKLDHQPVVAIIGQQKTFSLGANYQQEVDHDPAGPSGNYPELTYPDGWDPA